jgi:hypothetical protein
MDLFIAQCSSENTVMRRENESLHKVFEIVDGHSGGWQMLGADHHDECDIYHVTYFSESSMFFRGSFRAA